MSPEARVTYVDDRSLAEGIAARDPAAEEAFAVRFRPGLLAIARIRGAGEEGTDLVQETLMAGLLNLRRGEWRGEGPLSAYLATILRRLISRHSGRPREISSGALSSLPGASADPESSAEISLAAARVRRALREVSVQHREALIRHYLHGESAREIAQALGISRGTVLSRLYHARARLAGILNR